MAKAKILPASYDLEEFVRVGSNLSAIQRGTIERCQQLIAGAIAVADRGGLILEVSGRYGLKEKAR